MRIEFDWIYFADKALRDVGIVENGMYPEEFKGYLSSFGATIVQMGMYPTLLVYENEEADTSAKRSLLPKAVLYMLSCVNNNRSLTDLGGASSSFLESTNREHCEISTSLVNPLLNNRRRLSEQYINSNNREKLSQNIEKALVALKIAIRMYQAQKDYHVECRLPDYEPSNRNVINDDGIHKVRERINNKSNVGWLFYRDYYRNYTTDNNIQAEEFKLRKNPYIFNSQLNTSAHNDGYTMISDNKAIKETLENSGFQTLTFKTLYPGLAIGLGLSHGTKVENDLKCGFQFDYTTGLPYIPGSSVKGVLRSVFPFKGDEKEDLKYRYIESLLKDKKNGILDGGCYDVEFSKEDIKNLAKDIFVHEDKSSYDIFMDAIITNGSGNFISDDYLAPHHDNVFAEPTPIQFIKVKPNIEFTFFFKLTECKCNGVKINLKNLFKCILEDIGVGAKTNVGYGQLKFVR